MSLEQRHWVFYKKSLLWDQYFLGMAEYASRKSKDPSTKVGAVIVRPDKSVASIGFNGFPKGVEDNPEQLNDRSEKYPRIIHAERNALNFLKEDATGYTLYVWPIPPCSVCSGDIIQNGIKRVVCPPANDRWADSCSIGTDMFEQAGVCIDEIELIE
jgi:dCMP deaminase